MSKHTDFSTFAGQGLLRRCLPKFLEIFPMFVCNESLFFKKKEAG